MIRFDKVSKAYPDGTVAVHDVTLEIPSRSTVVLVGSSGSGKTTLLRMVNRMIEPTGGRVLIDDEDIRVKDPVALRRSIGYVLQAGGLLPHRTIADNIATVPILNGAPRSAARKHALEQLELVGLDTALAGRFPSQLSGGQQQRVGVARALAADPNILLMDEPFGAVDPIVRRGLQDELRRIQRELGKTILFVTHDIDEAFALGDHIVILRAGGLVAQMGTPEQLLTNPADEFVAQFVGSSSASRRLTIDNRNGARLVSDASGRFVGTLDA